MVQAQHDNMNMHKPKHKSGSKSNDDDGDDEEGGESGTFKLSESFKLKSFEMKLKGMTSGYSLNLPMSRDGSGTSWAPDANPMYGYMIQSGRWLFTVHGDLFARYNRQDITQAGSRGAEKWDAPSMVMAMGQRKIGKRGLFHFTTMFSADAFIAGGNGYPLLFQTGESWEGKPLVDRQHPHDLFSELSVNYTYAFSEKADISLYAGYPGAPALGPSAFMHRISGNFNPDAPLGHHWEDGTHIAFGVGTLGFRYNQLKLEFSSFTGREPDEIRYDFDPPLFDSWSSRLSFNPDPHVSLQVSHGFIKSPEMLNPLENINRTTASATFALPIAVNKFFTATLLWGQNQTPGRTASNAALAEATLKIKKLAVYSRYEWVNKSDQELALSTITYNPYRQHNIQTITIGAGYDLINFEQFTIAAGGQISGFQSDAYLAPFYGTHPLSGEVYLHFYLFQGNKTAFN